MPPRFCFVGGVVSRFVHNQSAKANDVRHLLEGASGPRKQMAQRVLGRAVEHRRADSFCSSLMVLSPQGIPRPLQGASFVKLRAFIKSCKSDTERLHVIPYISRDCNVFQHELPDKNCLLGLDSPPLTNDGRIGVPREGHRGEDTITLRVLASHFLVPCATTWVSAPINGDKYRRVGVGGPDRCRAPFVPLNFGRSWPYTTSPTAHAAG